LTQLISRKIGEKSTDDMPEAIWTALIMVFGLSLLAGMAVFFAAPFLTELLQVSREYRTETIYSFYFLASSLPFLILIICLKGILEAFQKFKIISLLRTPVILFNYVAPVFVIPFTTRLSDIVLMLVIGRVISFFLHLFACIHVIENIMKKITFSKKYASSLLNFGGWITMSGIITPLMGYMDRFFVAGMLSAQAVAYYTTPYDVIIRLGIVSNSIIAVMFPAFGTSFVQDKAKTLKMYHKTLKYIFWILLFPLLIILLFAKSAFSIWLSPDFAGKSYKIVQILAVCITVNSVVQVPYAMIQAAGRSDITGKLHLIELPVYILLLWFSLKNFGILGAPVTFLVKVLFDACFLHATAIKILKNNTRLRKN
jgi:O-antigen/teichoic acid export membrane protein